MHNTKRWLVIVASCLFGLWIGREISQVVMASSITQLAYRIVQNAGTPLTQRNTMNFHGGGVAASDSGGVTDINIPGGGGGGTGAPNTACPFSMATTVTCTHNLGTTSVIVQCFDNSSPPLNIEWNSLAITNSNVVTITFSVGQSGTCYINGTQGSGQSVISKSMTFTVDATMNVILCTATGGVVSANLPPIATAGQGRQYSMKKVDASGNSCTFTANGAETIDGSATRTNTVQFQSYTIITDGVTGWYII